MILFFFWLRPVVSISNTIYSVFRSCPLGLITRFFRSSTKYPSQPKISLKPSFIPFACAAIGNACATPWSVIAIAGCPQSFARFTIFSISTTLSISLITVCICNSTRFSSDVSTLGTRKSGICLIPRTDAIFNSLEKVSYNGTPFNR